MSRLVSEKIQFVMDALHVKRYHTERIIEEDTVGHHSAGVAAICHLLEPDCSRELLLSALYHDIGEKFTGDTPGPFKRRLREDKVLEEKYEWEYLQKNGVYPWILTTVESQILKAADLLNLIYKAFDEIEMGNQKAIPILGNGISYLSNLTLPLHIVNKVLECVELIEYKVMPLIHDKSAALIIRRAVEDLNIGILSPTLDLTTSKDKSPDTSSAGEAKAG